MTWRNAFELQETCRMQNPDIPRAGRGGAPGGAAGRSRARLGANRNVRPDKQKVHRTFQCIEETSLQRLPRSTNERNPMLTGGGTKPAVDPRFLTSSLLVYHRFVTGAEVLVVPGCRPVERRLYVSVNPFHVRHVGER